MQLRLYVIDNTTIEMPNLLQTMAARMSYSVETSEVIAEHDTLTLRKNQFPAHNTDYYHRLYIEK